MCYSEWDNYTYIGGKIQNVKHPIIKITSLHWYDEDHEPLRPEILKRDQDWVCLRISNSNIVFLYCYQEFSNDIKN